MADPSNQLLENQDSLCCPLEAQDSSKCFLGRGGGCGHGPRQGVWRGNEEV